MFQEAWEYGAWKRWRRRVKLRNIVGKYLCLEGIQDDNTETKVRHLMCFLTKFEHFVKEYYLRPFDVLLLVVGLQIECHHHQIFYPQRFALMIDDVQQSLNKFFGVMQEHRDGLF